ncbi:hypothetical protein Vadar_018752 [Vaccinium darrowii]|uniref:Uncharacterized protein n=1 Tax=Vaccinium darrowii TaxID=229202 RepID=A0ACB7XZZ0_9ERIC|nr:hypothetical protein Vadar_018752 [Vaccinium darrowii]
MGWMGGKSKCPWEVYAAKVITKSTYQVGTYRSKHKCGKTYSNKNVTSTVIAKRYMDDLRVNPRMPIVAFKDRVRKELKVDVSRTQLYKAKGKAARLIMGLAKNNMGGGGSIVRSLGDPIQVVKRGFLEGCRKIVGVDGCHLKGEYSGQLLAVIGVDPNNSMYPMAWCVLENENKDTWTWFITLLKMDLNITETNEHEWIFINDSQKGLLSLLNEELVRAEHRYCCKHILSNFQKQFKGLSAENNFWACAKASHIPLFNDEMEFMKKEDLQEFERLAKIAPRHCTRSHFKDSVKCDMVCNNLSEAFNRAILEAWDKPNIEMLEWIRCYLSKRMVIRREWIRKFNDELLPNCYDKLEKLKDYSANASAIWFGELQFQVKTEGGGGGGGGGGEQYTVDLNLKTCNYRRWDLTGKPCAHAIATIHERHQRPEEFIHPCYSKSSYTKAYQTLINHINGYKMWPNTPVLPLDGRRKQGRPKMKRYRGPEEYLNPKDPEKLRKLRQNSVYCRRCGIHGHNKRTCTPQLNEATGDVGGEVSGNANQTWGRGMQAMGGSDRQGRGSGMQARGKSGGVRMRGAGIGVQARGRGRSVGVRMRGGAMGVRGRGTARGYSEVNVPSNFAQATQDTQGSQASSVVTTLTTQPSGNRYANINTLHGIQ